MTIEIPLTRGMVSLIDCDDLHFAMGRKWYADRKGNTAHVNFPQGESKCAQS